MGDDTDPQPIAVRPEPLGEPRRLGFADEAVVVLRAVAHRDRRVETRHHGAELGQLEQRPRLGGVEDRSVEPLVELLEQAGEVLPLRPVRRRRAHVVRLAAGEIGLAGLLVNVPRARNDDQAVGLQPEQHPQSGQESERLLVLTWDPGLGEVAGHDEQVRPGRSGVGEPGEVTPDAGLQLARLQRFVALRQPTAEARPGDVQQGDRVRTGRPVRRREGGRGHRGAPELRAADGVDHGVRGRGLRIERESGPLSGLGPADQRLLDPGQQEPPRLLRVGHAHEVYPGDRAEQAFERDVLQPHCHQLARRIVRIGAHAACHSSRPYRERR